ncbi:MAG: hypothetical protein HKN36_02510 [Hellea sp.]|nr:hypothetical protein [Hellea sp.]
MTATPRGFATEPVLVPAQPSLQPVQIRQRSANEFPRVGKSLASKIFASSLGDIQDLSVGAGGEIYVLDGRQGRILSLSDRYKTGNLDLTRTFASGFVNPQSMSLDKTDLFVSDQSAVWKVNLDTGAKIRLASLQNAGADIHDRPIIGSQDGAQILLGLNFENDSSKIIAIDKQSGQASQLAVGKGRLTALAQAKGTPLWVGIDHQIVPVKAGQYNYSLAYELDSGASIAAIYLPSERLKDNSPLTLLAGKFIVVQGREFLSGRQSGTGRNLIAIASNYGIPYGKPEILAGGFWANHGRASWGRPEALAWDERGLFLADSQNQLIWHISKMEEKTDITKDPTVKPVKFYKDDIVEKPKAEWGSSIGEGSLIEAGSLIEQTDKTERLIPEETLMQQLRREDDEKREADD